MQLVGNNSQRLLPSMARLIRLERERQCSTNTLETLHRLLHVTTDSVRHSQSLDSLMCTSGTLSLKPQLTCHSQLVSHTMNQRLASSFGTHSVIIDYRLKLMLLLLLLLLPLRVLLWACAFRITFIFQSLFTMPFTS